MSGVVGGGLIFTPEVLQGWKKEYSGLTLKKKTEHQGHAYKRSISLCDIGSCAAIAEVGKTEAPQLEGTW